MHSRGVYDQINRSHVLLVTGFGPLCLRLYQYSVEEGDLLQRKLPGIDSNTITVALLEPSNTMNYHYYSCTTTSY